jgi:hypothetical protein
VAPVGVDLSGSVKAGSGRTHTARRRCLASPSLTPAATAHRDSAGANFFQNSGLGPAASRTAKQRSLNLRCGSIEEHSEPPPEADPKERSQDGSE